MRRVFWKTCVMVLLVSSCKTAPNQQVNESDLESLRGKHYHLVLHPTPEDATRLAFYACHRFDGSLQALRDKGLFTPPSRCVSAFQDAYGNPVSYNRDLVMQEKEINFESLRTFVEENKGKTDAEIQAAFEAKQGVDIWGNVGGAMLLFFAASVAYGVAAKMGKVPPVPADDAMELVAILGSITIFAGGGAGLIAGGAKTQWYSQRLKTLENMVNRCKAELARLEVGLGDKEVASCKMMQLRLPSFDQKRDVDARDYLGAFSDKAYDTPREVPHVMTGLARFFKRVEFGYGDSQSKSIAKTCLPSWEIHSTKTPRGICIDVEEDWKLYNWMGQRKKPFSNR